VLSIPPKHGIGTLIFNLRLNVEMLKTPEKRAIVKSLITSFFKRGGMQIQVTIVDQETLRKAYEKPEDYPNLMVRIGGYSEYYTRLSRTLQAEILKRTEHCC
jgi:formate C-acetyltransferase